MMLASNEPDVTPDSKFASLMSQEQSGRIYQSGGQSVVVAKAHTTFFNSQGEERSSDL